MWLLVKRSFLTLLFLIGLGGITYAQNITGIWRGYFITDGMEQYKFELQIEQTPSNRISGVSYSYLDTRFYGKATLTGSFSKSTQSALVQEIKTVEVRMAGASVACIMNCQFDYVKSGNEEFLEGIFTSKYEKTNPEFGTKRGGDCGGGKVFLRKVPTSDFYVEPFLRDKPTVKKTTPAQNNAAKPPVAKKPVPKTTTTQPKSNSKTKTTSLPPAKKPDVTDKRKTSEVKKEPETIKDHPQKTVIKPKAIAIPAQTRSRTNELIKTLTLENETVIVKLYDNGEIDDDTISVYMDDQLILSKQRLSASPITVNLKMDEANPEHVLVMVAENLGRIPPNTSLMIVQDGDKRYEVRITSTEQKNAMVRFRYQKSAP
jgi:hypothetical protein